MKIDNAKIRPKQEVSPQEEKKSTRVSAYSESYKGEYYNIDAIKLIPFKNQSRKYFDQKSLEELASTIKEHGVRQPLTVLPSSEYEGKYEIISGERRWKAAQIAGLTKIPCIILHNTEAADEIALIENIQRQDLHPLELMQAFQSLLDRKICHSTQEIATKLGIHKSAVVEALALSNLPSHTQLMLLDEGVKARKVLRDLLKSTPEKHKDIIKSYKESIKKGKSDKQSKTKTKVLSIYINKGRISIQKNQLPILSSEEKLALKQSLLGIIQEIS